MQQGRIFYLYSLIICWIKAAEGHPYCSASGCVNQEVSECFEYKGLFYMAYGKCLLYDEAEKYCKDRDMILTSMRTQDFVEFFKSITCVYYTKDTFLIGVRRISGVWMNSDGSVLPRSLFSNWDVDNTEGYDYDPEHNCAYYSSHEKILWHDWWCSSLRGKFACESELGQCTHDNVQTKLINDNNNRELVKNDIMVVGGFVRCEINPRNFYFDKWSIIYTCNDLRKEVDCVVGNECKMKVVKLPNKLCSLKCTLNVKSRYLKYVTKGKLNLTFSEIHVKVEESVTDDKYDHIFKDLDEDITNDLTNVGTQSFFNLIVGCIAFLLVKYSILAIIISLKWQIYYKYDDDDSFYSDFSD